jgi:hypothetical protein
MTNLVYGGFSIVKNKWAYIISSTGSGGTIDYYNLSNPTSPILIRSFNVSNAVYAGGSVYNNYLFCANYGAAGGASGYLDIYGIGFEDSTFGQIFTSDLNSNGTSNFNKSITNSITATTISGGTLYSGSTELSVVMQSLVSSNETFIQPGLNTYTGGTNFKPTVNISAATLSFLNVSGTSSFTGGLSANTLSGGTIISGNTNLYNIFQSQSNVLKQKNGIVSGSTFSGNPKKATVTFSNSFPSDYAVTVSGDIDRTWTIESKTLSGFTINANANLAFNSNNVFWMAGQIGENN